MRRITQQAFEAKFPSRTPIQTRDGAPGESITVASDTVIKGIPRHVTVKAGALVEIYGLVEGTLTVERGAAVYVHGLIDGSVNLDGAMCVCGDGHVAGHVRCGADAIMVDPTGPVDN